MKNKLSLSELSLFCTANYVTTNSESRWCTRRAQLKSPTATGIIIGLRGNIFILLNSLRRTVARLHFHKTVIIVGELRRFAMIYGGRTSLERSLGANPDQDCRYFKNCLMKSVTPLSIRPDLVIIRKTYFSGGNA